MTDDLQAKVNKILMQARRGIITNEEALQKFWELLQTDTTENS
jgi:hypothetical protein